MLPDSLESMPVPDSFLEQPYVTLFAGLAELARDRAPTTSSPGNEFDRPTLRDASYECLKPQGLATQLSGPRTRGKRPKRDTSRPDGPNHWGKTFAPISLADLRDKSLCSMVYSRPVLTAYSGDDHREVLMPDLARLNDLTLVELHERHNLVVPGIAANFSDEEIARARTFMRGDIAPGTARVYEYWWHYAQLWLWRHGLAALPMEPDAMVMLLAEHAEFYAYSTLSKILWAIHKAHEYAGLIDRSPALTHRVAACLAGIARKYGSREDGKLPVLEWMWPIWRDRAQCDPNWKKGLRDLAILGLGWAIAGRPGELCDARRHQLRRRSDFYTFFWPFSKTDQFGRGYEIAVTRSDVPGIDVVAALDDWLALIPEGRYEPIFREVDRHGNIANVAITNDGLIRSGGFYTESLNRLVKKYIGYCGEQAGPYGGYSLRVGFVTWAVESGFGDSAIMKVTRHVSLATLRKYFRPDALFRERLLGARPVAQPFSAAAARGY